MSAAELRAQIVPMLEDAWALLSPLVEKAKERLETLDPATRVAAAFAAGFVLGKVVSRVGR